MWKPIEHPGPWLNFLQRKDNVGVPLMEVRKKYLVEELQYDSLNTTDPSANNANAGNPLNGISSLQVVDLIGDYSGIYQQSIAESLGILKNGTIAWARLVYSGGKGGAAPIPTGDYRFIQWVSQFSKWQVRLEAAGVKVVPYLSATTSNINPFGEYTQNNLGIIKTLKVQSI